MKKFAKAFFSPMAQRMSIYLIEIAITVNLILYLNGRYSGAIHWLDVTLNFMRALSAIVFFHIIFNRKITNEYRVNWILVLVLSPSFGGLIYLIFAKRKPMPEGLQKTGRLKRGYHSLAAGEEPEESKALRRKISGNNPAYFKTMEFFAREASMGVFADAKPKYFTKESGWEDILESLKSAEISVEMEFFIISSGNLLDEIRDILAPKIPNGLEVRILYDDFGCIGKLRRGELEGLRGLGFQVRRFNRLGILPTQELNYRNHRKIVAIDGKRAYVGGINLADEYHESKASKYGYWHDSVLRFEGEMVKDALRIFEQDWKCAERGGRMPLARLRIRSEKRSAGTKESAGGSPCEKMTKDQKCCRAVERKPADSEDKNGFCQLYASTPFDERSISKNVLMSLLWQSQRTFCLTSPYLALDDDVMESLALSAKSGVRIKIAVPGVPDKKIAYAITKSHFNPLIENGIEVYKLKGGFMHSKLMICDGITASVGSANADSRSFFLDFENGALLYDSPEIEEIEREFDNILAASEKVVWRKESILRKILNLLLRFMAPMF